MMRRLLSATALAATALLAGCYGDNVRPLPGTLPSEAALLQTDQTAIAHGFVLRRRSVLVSPYWNDFYPLNVPDAELADEMVSELLLKRGMHIEKIDWAEMAGEGELLRRHVSADGQRVVYSSPTLMEKEGQYPRRERPDIRPLQVAIFTKGAARPVRLGDYNGMSGLGAASFWRTRGDRAAFTTICRNCMPARRSLAIVTYGGEVIADISTWPDLAGLEFVRWSPDGRSVVALRPARPGAGGVGGGQLVQVTPEDRSISLLGHVSPDQAIDYLGHFERLVWWEGNLPRLIDDD